MVVVDMKVIPAPRAAEPSQRRGRRATAGAPSARLRGGAVARSGAAGLWSASALVAAVAVLPALAADLVPTLAAAMIWMLAGVLVLRSPFLLMHIGIAGAAVGVAVGTDVPAMPAVVLCLVILDGMVLGFGTSRSNTSAQLALGESMLGALRERLDAQGVIPPLEPGWQVETALRAAYGDAFSGDFLVAARAEGDECVEFALVDVSGKGRGAGSRALLLSGAFGGMLGALPAETFLAAANRYLLRQRWDEGFATVVHAQVDLSSGQFRVAGAGHPPAARFHAGSGRWEVFGEEQGPLLGVVEDAEFPAVTGRLDRGDALLLYTDGLVESPGRDLRLGIDRLLGQAERVMTRGFHGGAVAIMDGAPGGNSDDRALVLVWRS